MQYPSKEIILEGCLEEEFVEEFFSSFPEKHYKMTKEFSVEKAQNMLNSLQLIPQDCPVSPKRLGFSCAGALLSHFVKAKPGEQNYPPQILKVSFFSLEEFMHLDDNAIFSLSIFDFEEHPNSFSNRTKESFSLFNLFNFTKTSGGKKMLTSWFRRPLMDVAQINDRLDAVEAFVHGENEVLVVELQSILRKVKNIPKVIGKFFTFPSATDFESLNKFCKAAQSIQRLSDELCNPPTIIQRLSAKANNEIWSSIQNIIEEAVNFEESFTAGRIALNPSIDSRLENFAATYRELPEILLQTCREISQDFPPELADELEVIYFPQVGYLTVLPEEYCNQIPSNWRISFRNEGNAYLQSQVMHQLDEELGDIYSKMVDVEIELIQVLKERIVPFKSEIITFYEACCEIDCILSLCTAAKKYSLKRPFVEAQGKSPEDSTRLEAKNARHIMQEIVVDSFIPNDFSIENSRQTILTGPNCSGKSVYLKQIGIICILAQIGSFIPASSASLSVVDAIFTRMRTKETVSLGCSSFQIELNQVLQAITQATKKSLILIDEFGKGTESADGIGLMCGILNYHATVKGPSAKIIYATHFHEIYSYFSDSPRFNWLYMDSIEQEDVKNVIFLYTVREGFNSNSFGCFCAKIAGIPQDLIDRAEAITRAYLDYQPIEPLLMQQKYQGSLEVLDLLQQFVDLSEDQEEELAIYRDKLLSIEL